MISRTGERDVVDGKKKVYKTTDKYVSKTIQ